MTMPNRMHGEPEPPEEGNIKTCPHCKQEFVKAKLVRRGETIIKLCPKCGKEIQ